MNHSEQGNGALPIENRSELTRFAWLSIGAAVFMIALKLAAYWITGSVGLLSDAIDSTINLISAVIALVMLFVAARPPDEEHAYGHDKAEYFSSGLEGGLIFIAALWIVYEAIMRLLNPQPLESPIIGLAVAAIALVINLAVALILLRVGKENKSITLEADGQHLMTDVWLSGGVILGVAAVALTGWFWLDPLIAFAVAINIVWTGWNLVRRSVLGLMDTALPEEDLEKINGIQEIYKRQGVQFHALRSRQAASRRFVSMHVLVPGEWTVQHGHQLLEKIEADIRRALPNITVFTHLESLNDPASWDDTTLDRKKQTEKVETPPG